MGHQHNQLLIQGRHGTVNYCKQCEQLQMNIGPVSLRLKTSVFLSVVDMMVGAREFLERETGLRLSESTVVLPPAGTESH